MFQDLEDDLRADVVREVADHGDRSGAHRVGVHAQEIAVADIQSWIGPFQVLDGFTVHFVAHELGRWAVDQVPCERTCAGTHFHHMRVSAVSGQAVRDAAGDVILLQEVLPQMLLRANVHQVVCITSSRVRKAANFPP